MTQPVEMSLDTKCYLCERYYANSQDSFFVYKCFLCMKFTFYCISCELILQKLFGKGNFFKCMFCDKLTNALDKLEIGSQKFKNNISNNSFFKTPSKPFIENNIPISSIRQNNHSKYFINNNKEEERKDNNSNINNPNNIVISNFLTDFNKINIDLSLNEKTINDNKSISSINNNNKFFFNKNINTSDTANTTNRTLANSNSLSNLNSMNNFSLLTSKSRLNKRFCLNESLLGRKRDDSVNASEYRQPSKIINRNPRSRGKFKNLISMKMSKMYKNDNNSNNPFINKNESVDKTLDEYRKKNSEIKNVFLSSLNNNNNDNNEINSGFGFNLLRDNKNTNNIFVNRQSNLMNFSGIDGKSTPHRLSSNNSFEYF